MKFTRILLLFTIPLILLAWQCHAQDDLFGPGHRFEGGIVFGTNITKVDGSTYTGYHKVGIEAGGMVYIHLGHSIGVSMEMLYSQKGARGANVEQSYAIGTYFDKYYLNINYIEIPLVLHLRRGLLDYEAGATYGLLVKTKEWAEADVPVIINPVLSAFNTEDYNYLAGIMARFAKHWSASIRYQYSIVPIRTWDRVPPRYSQYGVNEYNSLAIIRMIYLL